MRTPVARLAGRPYLIAAACLAVTVLAAVPLSRLRLQTDLLALLPAGAPAAEDYRIYLERFGGLEKVFLLVLPAAAADEASADGDSVGLLTRAAAELETLLADSPEVASVRAGLRDEDETFFLDAVVPRSPLLLRDDDWRRRVEARLEPDAVRRRVAELRAVLQTPVGLASSALARRDPLGFHEDLDVLAVPGGLPLDPLTSTFLSADGRAALLVLTPGRAEIDPEGGRALLAQIEAARAALPAELRERVRIEAIGGPLYAAHDEALLRQDLSRTLTGSLLGTTVVLVVAFEGLLLSLTALVPLLVALVWTGGAVALVHGDLNAVSIGFGAVLVGLGIDYGIHGGAQFRQRVGTLDALDALDATVRHTGPGILTSALTTAAGFAVLGGAHLPPLRELGLLVSIGCLTILAAMTTLGAVALVRAAPRLRPPGSAWHLLGGTVTGLTGTAARFPRTVLAVAAVLTAVALWGTSRLAVEPDLRGLRPENHPAERTEELLVRHFGLGLDTANLVVRGDDLDAALASAEAAATVLREALPEAEVTSPSDVLASSPQQRLAELSALPFDRAADVLEEELRAANLNPRAFEAGIDALRAFGRGEEPATGADALRPDWLREAVRVEDGAAWISIGLRLPQGTWPDGPPADVLARIEAVAPGSSLASAVALGAELRETASEDLRNLALLALGLVSLVVVLSFRGRLGYSLLTLLPVVLGSLWTLGLWSAAGRPLGLFSLAVLPIMLGIGLDDGLHVMHGVRRASDSGSDSCPGRLRAAVDAAGHGLLLTTLTTCVGFSSLALSTIPGLRDGGLLIAAGVLACWVCTVLVLPALEAISGKRT